MPTGFLLAAWSMCQGPGRTQSKIGDNRDSSWWTSSLGTVLLLGILEGSTRTFRCFDGDGMTDMLWLLLFAVWCVVVWLIIRVVSLTRRMEDASCSFVDGVYQPCPTKPLFGYTPSRPINPANAPKGDPLLKGQALATATKVYGPPPPKAPKPPSAESAQGWPDGTKGHIPGKGPRPTAPPPPAPSPNPNGIPPAPPSPPRSGKPVPGPLTSVVPGKK